MSGLLKFLISVITNIGVLPLNNLLVLKKVNADLISCFKRIKYHLTRLNMFGFLVFFI